MQNLSAGLKYCYNYYYTVTEYYYIYYIEATVGCIGRKLSDTSELSEEGGSDDQRR